MEIILVNQTRLLVSEKGLYKKINQIFFELKKNKNLKNLKKLERPELSLVLLSKQKMKKLNNEFRHKNYATDVLSFSSSTRDSLGDLVFCPVVLEKQAIQQGHSLDKEFLYMMIHGILHLLGYDHEKTKAASVEMFSLQDRIFNQIINTNI